MRTKRLLKNAAAFAISAALLLSVCACRRNDTMSSSTIDLMNNIKAVSIKNDTKPSDDFIMKSGAFSLGLFKQSFASQQEKSENEDKSLMISPLSVMMALSMTANGADGETLAQMEEVLGGLNTDGSDTKLSLDDLNKYLSAYAANLPSSEKAKLSIANSIWLHSGKVDIKEDFLKTNAAYYNADIYGSKFDKGTMKDINNWVSEKTDGMIENMMDDVSENAIMYLINALAFDAEWGKIYTENNIHEGEFNGTLGKQSVDMMSSTEAVYIDDGNATGFVKPYASGYSFVAMLPNEDISVEDYINSMNWNKFMYAIGNARETAVQVTLPKFKAEYSAEMNDTLKAMGINDAFESDKANFSKMADENLYIDRVMHKTFINVDERGTKAGAATSVEMRFGIRCGVMIPVVCLDRPFVYMIIENETKLPVFIGTVMNVND